MSSDRLLNGWLTAVPSGPEAPMRTKSKRRKASFNRGSAPWNSGSGVDPIAETPGTDLVDTDAADDEVSGESVSDTRRGGAVCGAGGAAGDVQVMRVPRRRATLGSSISSSGAARTPVLASKQASTAGTENAWTDRRIPITGGQ